MFSDIRYVPDVRNKRRYINPISISKILILTMFRLAVIGKTEDDARHTAEWAVSGEKSGESYVKKYESSGQPITLTAFPITAEKPAQPICDCVLIVCKNPAELSGMEGVVSRYMKVPIKFILYDGVPEGSEYEMKWDAKPIKKSDPMSFVNKLITANNDLVKLIANVFKNFDKDHSGYIEVAEIKSLSKELGTDISESEADDTIKALDVDKDGKISMTEFIEWWKTGRQGSTVKFGGLIDNWLKKNPIAQKAVEALTTLKEGPTVPEKMLDGCFAVHINRVKAPGVQVQLSVMTKGTTLNSEFQNYAGAAGLKPNEPFLGIGFGVKNPKEACGKLKDVAEAAIMMAQSFLPPAAEALTNVEFKYGETTNKVVACVVPSAKGSAMIAPFLGMAAPFGALILPGQLMQFTLAFATDLNKLISEDKAFYELLMEGITLEGKSTLNPLLSEKIQQIVQSLPPTMFPPHVRLSMMPSLMVNQWFQSGKGELEFEIDEELKTMIKNEIGPHPASMPLKDLKAMFAPQAQEIISQIPIAEMAHTFFKDEVSSLEFFVYLTDLLAIKFTLNLPGLGNFISL